MLSHTASLSRRTVLRNFAALAALPAASSLAFAQQRPAPRPAPNQKNTDWPCFRGPNHNGTLAQNFTLLPGGPKLLWEEKVNNGHASLAIVADRLYTFGSRAENLVCLNALTGQKIWKRTIETHYGAPTPSVEGDRVYAQTSMDAINHLGKKQIATAYCCEAASGEVLWKRALPPSTGDRQYGHAGSPRIWQDLVLHNAGGGAALKKQSGEIAWAHEGFPGLATPVIFEHKAKPAVAFFGGDRLIARDARSGQQLFEIPWKTDLAVNACDPVIFDNKLFICTNYGRGLALYDIAANQPRLLWETGKNSGASYSSGFVRDGNLYCFTSRAFARLDLATGRPLWETDGSGTATLIGDKLIRVRENGQVSIGPFSPDGFRAALTHELDMKELKAPPAYSAGRLYLRSGEGRLVCLQVGTLA
jgi:outer membrane protein assembly factor BamB